MPDWIRYVRRRLEVGEMCPERVAEIEEELAQQLEDVYRAALAAGLSEEQALARCREHVPDWEAFSRRLVAEDPKRSLDTLSRWQQRHEDSRIGKGVGWGTDLSKDVLFAARTLARKPLFAGVAIVTIAVAIAATTSIFSVVNGVLLTQLPYEEPDRLVMVWEHNLTRNNLTNPVSPANYLDWRDEASVFDSIAMLAQSSATLTGDHEPERVGAMIVSADVFGVLGVQPAAGRLFLPEDDVPGATRTVVLSHGFWQRRYGGSEAILGQSILLDGSPVEVIGVLPPGFDFPMRWIFGGNGAQDVWTNPRWGEEARGATGRWLEVVARLKEGETPASAQAAMSALADRLAEKRPRAQAGWGINVMPLFEEVVGETRMALWVLFASVLFVLLIACANVANLMLSRAAARSQEMSVRSALGAGRFRLVRQLLTESLLIAVVGGLVGTLLSVWAIRVLLSMAPDGIPRLANVELDWRVLLFAAGVALATGVLFGLAPALRTSRADLSLALREGATRGGSRGGRGRNALVVAEIALCLVLLVGAGLMIRAFRGLIDTGVGFNTERLLTFTLELEDREAAERSAFFDELVNRIEAVAGVTSAGAGTFIPLGGNGSATSYWVNDRPRPTDAELPVADIRWIDTRLLETLGVPLLAGRHFETTDTAEAGLKIIVNQALADEFWPDGSALGRTLTMPWGENLVGEIVGVVGDVRHQGPAVAPRSKIYWYHRQFQDFEFMSIVARTSAEPTRMLGQLRNIVMEMDDTLALYNIGTMDGFLAENIAPVRFSMTLLSVFATVALLLAAGGIYGVMSCAVSERSRELGIRLALGAARSAVRWQVLRRGAVMVAVALVIGAGGALALSTFMESMLFGIVQPTDPTTFGLVALLLSVVALTACYVPARRASRVDPLETLRYE